MLLTDPAVTTRFGVIPEHVVTIGSVIGALLVVALGTYFTKRQQKNLPNA
jgi:membrane protein YqaA with SNARE-associated domain